MKKLLTSVAMFLCSLLSFAQFSGSGSGTESDPYLILNPIQLNQMRNFLNKEEVYFKMMADVDLTEFLEDENPTQGWQPVGTSSAPFKGVLDGNGKTISGFWINRNNSDDVGFFGYTSFAAIKNLTLIGSYVIGKDNIGLLSGTSEKTEFTKLRISGNVSGNNKTGGLVGVGRGVAVSDVTGEFDIIGKQNVGGLVGYLNSAAL